MELVHELTLNATLNQSVFVGEGHLIPGFAVE